MVSTPGIFSMEDFYTNIAFKQEILQTLHASAKHLISMVVVHIIIYHSVHS